MSDHLHNDIMQNDSPAGDRLATPRPPSLSDRVRSLRLQSPPESGSRFGRLPWALCVILLLLTTGFGIKAFVPPSVLGSFGGFGAAAKQAAPADDAAKAGSGDVALEQKGYIIPSRTYQVGPKVGGMVQTLNIKKEGDVFKQGEVLAVIEDVDYKADRDHAKATLDNANARLEQLRKELPEEIKKAEYELEQSKSQLKQYELDWERTVDLYQRHAIGKADYDLARANRDAKASEVNKLTHAHRLVNGSSEERIRALEAEVAQDKADWEKMKWKWENCIIKAPSDGTILTKNVEEGNLANPVAFQPAVSASICTMADLSKLEVDINIQERDIKSVYEGQHCRIQAEGFPDRAPYPGEVLRIMPNADRAKGAIPVRVKVGRLQDGEKPGQFLRPDTGVIVSFLKSDAKEAK
jgi:HlyD family secretion protein